MSENGKSCFGHEVHQKTRRRHLQALLTGMLAVLCLTIGSAVVAENGEAVSGNPDHSWRAQWISAPDSYLETLEKQPDSMLPLGRWIWPENTHGRI